MCSQRWIKLTKTEAQEYEYSSSVYNCSTCREKRYVYFVHSEDGTGDFYCVRCSESGNTVILCLNCSNKNK